MYREMSIHGFGLDQATRLPVIILTDGRGVKVPLWLNSRDLVPIATDLIGRELAGGKESADLLQVILGNLGLTPDRLFLDEEHDGGYRSTLQFQSTSGTTIMNLEHREAFLVALRYTLPVMVATPLIERLAMPSGIPDRAPEGGGESYDGLLENLDPKEMGKYPM